MKQRIIQRLHEEKKLVEDSMAVGTFNYYIAIIHSLRDLRNL